MPLASCKPGVFRNFAVDAEGDIQIAGNKGGHLRRVAIRNPFHRTEHVKVLARVDRGIATSGAAIRGQHLYDPYCPWNSVLVVVSITALATNVYDADRFAIAAFAMGTRGFSFLEKETGLEG